MHLGLGLGIHSFLHGLLPLIVYAGGVFIFFFSLLCRPIIGFYFTTLIIPLQTARYKLHAFPLGDQFLDLMLLGVILGLLKKEGKAFAKTPINKFLLVYAAVYYVWLWRGAFYLGTDLPFFITDPRFSDWKNYVEMFLFCLLAAQIVKNEKHAKWVVLTMALSCLVAFREFHSSIAGHNFSQFSFSLQNEGPLGYAGVNGFGCFMAMMGSFFLGVYAYMSRWSWKLGMLAVIACCAYCVVFSFSREAYAGLLVGFFVVGVFKQRKFLVLLALLAFCWQAVLPGAVKQRIEMTSQKTMEGTQLDNSAIERLVIWKNTLHLFAENPLAGTGYDTNKFEHAILKQLHDTHNYYLKVLVETGVLGMILYLFLLGKMYRQGFSLLWRSRDLFWSSLGLGFCAMMVCTTIVDFFGDRWTYQQLDGYLWILLGVVMRGLMILDEKEEQEDAEEALQSGLPPSLEPVTP